MTRPSTRWNVIKSSVTAACLTRASALTAMLTPSLLNLAQFSFNDRTDLIKLASTETVIVRKLYAPARIYMSFFRVEHEHAALRCNRSYRNKNGMVPEYPGWSAF